MRYSDGGIVGAVIALIVIGVIIYLIFLIASTLAMIAGGAGVLWGGGTALVNYGRSFKENMIDSNVTTVQKAE